MVKISVEQLLKKAINYQRKGEIVEAQKLYQQILQVFPKNIRAQQGLTNLINFNKNNTKKNPPIDVINQLLKLFNRGQFLDVVNEAQTLTDLYPNAFFIWNLLGVSTTQIGKIDDAIHAYKKAIFIKPDYVEAYNNMGVALQKKGKFNQSIEAYEKAISLKPDYAEAYNNLGNAFKDQGRMDNALKTYKKAIFLKPDYAEAYNNLGNALRDHGKLDEALDACYKSISYKPNYASAYNNIGTILSDQNKLEESIKAFRKAISLLPDYADAYNNIGNVIKSQGKLDEAIRAYEKAISLKPDYAEAYNNLAYAFKNQGRIDEALNTYKKIISFKPTDYSAFNKLGIAFTEKGDAEEALKAFKKAVLLKPDYAIAHNNIGNILKDQGKLDEAIEAYEKAISLKPEYADPYSNIGVIFKYQGDFDKAIKAYKKALFLKPDLAQAHLNFGITLLNVGRIKEGLEEYEWRWKTLDFLSHQRHFSQPMWNGRTSLKDKTLLLWSEQGIGDTMNWSSSLSLLSSCSGHIILECQEKLVPLLTRSFPNIEVKAEDKSKDMEKDNFDFHLPMGSLYKHFVDEITNNDKASSYLIPDPDRVKFWKESLRSFAKGPCIGLCWKSSVVSHYRSLHYPPISVWSPVLKIPDVTFINLQYIDYEEDISIVRDDLGVTIHNLKDIDQYNDIDEVAALCSALDIVVSTKATPPMISAGVGTLTKIANWRHSSYNNILNNPQCTSLQMIHKDTSERWDNVFSSIAEDIMKLTKKFRN